MRELRDLPRCLGDSLVVVDVDVVFEACQVVEFEARDHEVNLGDR
jgi:hypothetical protein